MRETRQPSIHLPPFPAVLTSISESAGPEPAAHGASPPSGPPLLLLLLPPAPAAEGLEGALSGGGGGGGSTADDMFRLRHPPRPRAGAAPREAAWACATLASGPPEERDPPGSSHARGLRHRPEPAQPRRAARLAVLFRGTWLHWRLPHGGNRVEGGGRGQRGHGGQGRRADSEEAEGRGKGKGKRKVLRGLPAPSPLPEWILFSNQPGQLPTPPALNPREIAGFAPPPLPLRRPAREGACACSFLAPPPPGL